MRFQYYEIRPCVDLDGDIISFLGTYNEHGQYTRQSAYAEALQYGEPFWTLYGISDRAVAIGDFTSFAAAYEVMQAILLPMRDACDRHYDAELDDICNQSTTEERL